MSKIYCSHVWIYYQAEPPRCMIGWYFCHRCQTTYLPGQGLVVPEVEIGYTLTPEEEQTHRIITSDFQGHKL